MRHWQLADSAPIERIPLEEDPTDRKQVHRYTNLDGGVDIDKGFHIDGTYDKSSHGACSTCSVCAISWDVRCVECKTATETEFRLEFAELRKSHASAAALSDPDLATELTRRGQHDAAAILFLGGPRDPTIDEVYMQMKFDFSSRHRARTRELSLSAQREALEERVFTECR
jgi:hypothetical protein